MYRTKTAIREGFVLVLSLQPCSLPHTGQPDDEWRRHSTPVNIRYLRLFDPSCLRLVSLYRKNRLYAENGVVTNLFANEVSEPWLQRKSYMLQCGWFDQCPVSTPECGVPQGIYPT
jgi:hypothetical protein